jgi:uncharacterized protein (DUF1330 family)
MPAYVPVNVEITDPEGFKEYSKAVGATVTAYGGRYLARGGLTQVVEGAWSPKRVVILEFSDIARIRAWYQSPEYQPLIAIRQRTSNMELTIIDGT